MSGYRPESDGQIEPTKPATRRSKLHVSNNTRRALYISLCLAVGGASAEARGLYDEYYVSVPSGVHKLHESWSTTTNPNILPKHTVTFLADLAMQDRPMADWNEAGVYGIPWSEARIDDAKDCKPVAAFLTGSGANVTTHIAALGFWNDLGGVTLHNTSYASVAGLIGSGDLVAAMGCEMPNGQIEWSNDTTMLTQTDRDHLGVVGNPSTPLE